MLLQHLINCHADPGIRFFLFSDAENCRQRIDCISIPEKNLISKFLYDRRRIFSVRHKDIIKNPCGRQILFGNRIYWKCSVIIYSTPFK